MSASLARNSVGMAAGTILSRITGVLRDVAMTAALGFFVISDAYSLGNTLPNIIYILVAGGALNAVFIPQLVRHMKADDDDGKAFADRLLSAVGMLLLALSVLSVIAAPLIVDLYTPSTMGDSEYQLAVAFARLCLPQIFFYGVYTMLQQVLNARGSFAAAMFAPIANNVVAIVVFLGFLIVAGPAAARGATLSAEQVWWLGLGTTVGVAVQALVLLPSLLRSGYRFSFRRDWRGGGLGHAGNLAVWTILLVVANQLGYLVVSRLATSANLQAAIDGVTAAGLTTYQKAHLVFVLPHSVITVSLVTALLPKLSELAHTRDYHALAQQVGRALRVVLAFLVPVAALLAVTGADIAQLLFGYGAAGVEAARLTGDVVSIFALGLPAYSAVYVMYRAWYAMEDTQSPFLLAVLINLVNVVLALWFFGQADLSAKIASLGWAYTAAYVVAFLVAAVALKRRLPDLPIARAVNTFVWLAIAAGGSAFIVNLIGNIDFDGQLWLIARLGLQWTLGLALFTWLSALLKITEVSEGIKLAFARLQRRRP